MLIPVEQLIGTLTSAWAGDSLIMPIDADSYALLERLIPNAPDDWTYLQIRQGALYEIVRTDTIENGVLTVSRGMIGPTFAAGAEVSFIMGEAAMVDIITYKQLNGLTITGSGLITVGEYYPGMWGIEIDPVVIQSLSNNIVVQGNHENGFFIGARQAIGCCEDLAPEEEP